MERNRKRGYMRVSIAFPHHCSFQINEDEEDDSELYGDELAGIALISRENPAQVYLLFYFHLSQCLSGKMR